MERRVLFFVIVGVLIFNLSFSSSEEFGYNLIKPPITSNITNIFQNITILTNGTDLFLNNLSDVDVPSPQDGESLIWDSGLVKWISKNIITRWFVSTDNGFLYNDSDTLYFNDTLLNKTIDSRAGSVETDFNIFINGSSYNNINHNITAGDANDVEFVIIPGKKFIFGDTFT